MFYLTGLQEEIRLLEFSTVSAQRYAQEGRLEDWVHQYLKAGPWANPGFSEGLKQQPRWWNGPLEVRLADLSPAVGPEPGMEFVVDLGYWNTRIYTMSKSFTDPLSIPPLILEYRQGELSVRDGNTRYGAMRLLGWDKCWVIIWYNSEADYQAHTEILNLDRLSYPVTFN